MSRVQSSILTRPTGVPGRPDYAKQLLVSSEAYATSLLVLCIDRLGWGLLGEDGEQEWSPETVRQEVLSEFQVVLPDFNLDKIMAAMSLIKSDDFYQSLPKFIQICNILAGDTFDPTTFDPATCSEMAWGITEALVLEPPEGDEPFGDDIRYYVGAMLKEEGFATPPDVLRVALRDGVEDPLAIWSDDPELYSMGFAVQQDRRSGIEQMLQTNLIELVTQLEKLPLREGTTHDLLARMQQGLGRRGQ